MNLTGMDDYDDLDEAAERHRADRARVEGDTSSDLATAGDVLQSAGSAIAKLLAARADAKRKKTTDALAPPTKTPTSDAPKAKPWYVAHPWLALGAGIAGLGVLGLIAGAIFGGGKRRR